MDVEIRPFGTLEQGGEVSLICLDNGRGMTVEILSFGATLHRMICPDRQGVLADILLGQDRLDAIFKKPFGVGMTVGRFANRIAGGRYCWRGREVTLEKNQGDNTLHGASGCYGRKNFTVVGTDASAEKASVALSLHDPGWAGFPGAMDLTMTCTLDGENRLSLAYEAICTEDTACNLTNHAYFNLAGQDSGAVDAQCIQLFASHYLPTRADGVPTGEIRPVDGSAMDLRRPSPFLKGFQAREAQIDQQNGFDHCFVLDGEGMRLAACAYDEKSGRALETYTDQPGVQLYTANGFPPNCVGKDGAIYRAHQAFCLETQRFPNAVNEPAFPGAILRAGERYRTQTAYQLKIRA